MRRLRLLCASLVLLAAACLGCPPNSAPAGDASESVCVCEPGHVWNMMSPELGCRRCPPAMIAVDQSQCLQCPEFQSPDADQMACECAVGCERTSNMTDSPCKPCMIGTIDCVPCGENAVPLSVMVDSIPADADRCVCLDGFHGQPPSCERCPNGKLTLLDVHGIATCVCPPNSYMGVSGECVWCPSAQVSEMGSVSVSDCKCPFGFVGTPGGECSACPADRANTLGAGEHNVDQSACLCDGGYVSTSDNGCIRCPSGYYRPSDAKQDSSCWMCPADRPYSDPGAVSEFDCFQP